MHFSLLFVLYVKFCKREKERKKERKKKKVASGGRGFCKRSRVGRQSASDMGISKRRILHAFAEWLTAYHNVDGRSTGDISGTS